MKGASPNCSEYICQDVFDGWHLEEENDPGKNKIFQEIASQEKMESEQDDAQITTRRPRVCSRLKSAGGSARGEGNSAH